MAVLCISGWRMDQGSNEETDDEHVHATHSCACRRSRRIRRLGKLLWGSRHEPVKPRRTRPSTVRAASASVRLTDDNMAELQARQKIFSRPWEGEFRANALVLDAEQRICLVSLDSLNPVLPVTRSAARRIAAATGIPEDNILICATHTHRGPFMSDAFRASRARSTFAAWRREAFRPPSRRLRRSTMPSPAARATVLFGQSQEATVGRNSRLLLKDGCIGWDGYEEQDVVRPTGPYDPDLYVLALRRADGRYGGLAFNHSVHNIGHIREDCLSPCFYGLAALEVERRHGATTLFLPGAFGSTHNVTYKNSGVPAAECVHRVVDAIEEAISAACGRPCPARSRSSTGSSRTTYAASTRRKRLWR